jgi:fatty acid desaturase
MKYSIRAYEMPSGLIAELTALDSKKVLWMVAWLWAVVLTFAGLGVWLRTQVSVVTFCLIYPLLALCLAGRLGAFLQIVHEAAHRLISKKNSVNDFVGQWLAALPIGLNLGGYTSGHLQHHAYTNTERDLATDLEKHRITDLMNPRLYWLFLRDLIGITAVGSILGHTQNAGKRKKTAEPRVLPLLVLCQLVILAVVFQLNVINYVLFWFLPLISSHMALMRVRGIAEHGWPGQLQLSILSADEGNLYTRTVLPFAQSRSPWVVKAIEKFLIGTVACNFHHEHHLLPTVPYYHLSKLHDHLRPQVETRNPGVYVDGYLSAFLQGARKVSGPSLAKAET